MIGVGGVTFAVAFAALFWFTRTERAALQVVPAPIDTLGVAAEVTRMRRQLVVHDSVLSTLTPPRREMVRAAAVDLAPDSTRPATDSATDSVRVRPMPSAPVPDSVREAVAALNTRLERAQNAPLAASWRALAADPLLQQDLRVRALADSLADAERERNEYDAVGGVDPIYLELSSRVTGYGRAIERIAVARRDDMLRSAGAAVAPARTGPSTWELARRYTEDSVRYAAAARERDAVARALDASARALTARRTAAEQQDAARARAQRRVDALAPPAAMLSASAAAAIGVALLLTLMLEIRAPRVYDDREAALQSEAPVMLSLRDTDAVSPDALRSAFGQLVFDIEASTGATRRLAIVSHDPKLALRTATRIAERAAANGHQVCVNAIGDPARPVRGSRGTTTGTASHLVMVRPDRAGDVVWSRETGEPGATGAQIEIRAGTLPAVRAALLADAAPASILLSVRIASTPTAWLVRAHTELGRLEGADLLGLVTWSPDIEDTDATVFAYEQASASGAHATPADMVS